MTDLQVGVPALVHNAMADCLRRNANPERNLAIHPTTEHACFNSWSLFARSGDGVPDFGLSVVH
jgi:hypothetical protein